MTIKWSREPYLINNRKLQFWLNAILSFCVTVIAVLLLQPIVVREQPIGAKFELSLMIGAIEFGSWLLSSWLIKKSPVNRLKGVERALGFQVLLATLSAMFIIVFSEPVMQGKYLPSFELDWYFALNTLFCTFLVGFIILNCARIVDRFIDKKTNSENLDSQKEGVGGDQFSFSAEPVNLMGRNKGENLSIDASSFIYAQSKGHYVEVNYFNQDCQLDKFMIRNTISSLNEAFSDSEEVVFSHRSFLINKTHISEVLKSDNKTSLKMSSIEKPIPVSRANRNRF